MQGTKKRARSVDDVDYMVNKEDPQAKQPRQIAQPRLSRFHRANSNSQPVSNNGVVAPKDKVFSDIRAIAPSPQQQQQQRLGNAAHVNAANFALPPAGNDDMDVDMDGNLDMNGDMDGDMEMELRTIYIFAYDIRLLM